MISRDGEDCPPLACDATDRPLRKDAELNRQKILGAAAEVFATRGLTVTLDDIADHAGVGVGTVYRRFPSKEVLINALFEEKIEGLVARAEAAAADPDAWTALVGFLRNAVAGQAQDRGLRQVLHGTEHGEQRLTQARARMAEPLGRMVDAAKASGHLRRDFEVADLPVIMMMISSLALHPRTADPAVWGRYLDFVVDGLRERPGLSDLPTPGVLLPAAQTA